MPTLRGRKAPKFIYMFQSYSQANLHVQEYKNQLIRQDLREPTAHLETVFVFPSNVNHHEQPNYSPFDGNYGGLGLAAPAYTLKEAGIPVLGMPTTFMPGLQTRDPDRAKELREKVILDLWSAYGYGLNITLPVVRRRIRGEPKRDQNGQPKKNGERWQNTFFSASFKTLIDPHTRQPCEVEPSFWGDNEANPNPRLANFYNDELRLLCDFMTTNEANYSALDENSNFPNNPTPGSADRFTSSLEFRNKCRLAFLEGKRQALLPMERRDRWYLSAEEQRQLNANQRQGQQQQQDGQQLQQDGQQLQQDGQQLQQDGQQLQQDGQQLQQDGQQQPQGGQQQPLPQHRLQPQQIQPGLFQSVNFLSPTKQNEITNVLTGRGFELADTSPQCKTASLPANRDDKFDIYRHQLVTDRNNRVVFEGMLEVHKKVHGNFPLPKIDTTPALVDVWREACRAVYPDLGDKIRINGEVFIPRPVARL